MNNYMTIKEYEGNNPDFFYGTIHNIITTKDEVCYEIGKKRNNFDDCFVFSTSKPYNLTKVQGILKEKSTGKKYYMITIEPFCYVSRNYKRAKKILYCQKQLIEENNDDSRLFRQLLKDNLILNKMLDYNHTKHQEWQQEIPDYGNSIINNVDDWYFYYNDREYSINENDILWTPDTPMDFYDEDFQIYQYDYENLDHEEPNKHHGKYRQEVDFSTKDFPNLTEEDVCYLLLKVAVPTVTIVRLNKVYAYSHDKNEIEKFMTDFRALKRKTDNEKKSLKRQSTQKEVSKKEIVNKKGSFFNIFKRKG